MMKLSEVEDGSARPKGLRLWLAAPAMDFLIANSSY